MWKVGSCDYSQSFTHTYIYIYIYLLIMSYKMKIVSFIYKKLYFFNILKELILLKSLLTLSGYELHTCVSVFVCELVIYCNFCQHHIIPCKLLHNSLNILPFVHIHNS